MKTNYEPIAPSWTALPPMGKGLALQLLGNYNCQHALIHHRPVVSKSVALLLVLKCYVHNSAGCHWEQSIRLLSDTPLTARGSCQPLSQNVTRG